MAELLFAGYLAWVSWQDCRERLVVRYSHSLGLLAVIIIAIGRKGELAEYPMEYFAGCVIMVAVQFAAYKFGLYGLADVFVFLLCGLFMLFWKGTQVYLTAYAILFALSVCLLILVQFYKKNLKGLYLLSPVAYIPYICVAFILTNIVV